MITPMVLAFITSAIPSSLVIYTLLYNSCVVKCRETFLYGSYKTLHFKGPAMSDSKKQPLETILISSQRFRSKLYKILREKPGNVLISSISLEVILALSFLGTRGRTAEEILHVLELPNDVKTIKSGYNIIVTSLKSAAGITLEVANKIYSERSFPIQRDFLIAAKKTFLSEAESIDFIRNPNASEDINSWVKSKTNGKIVKLFEPGSLTSSSKMVLVNAVYFKGKWSKQFDPSKTTLQPFYMTAGTAKDIHMMHIQEYFVYRELKELKAKMLGMPYVGKKVFMVILLPNDIQKLSEMEYKMNSINIPELIKTSKPVKVVVTLPRFKIENNMNLLHPLEKLGIRSIFDCELADFSALTKEKGLFVDKVVQKSFIEVNEEGSEAAAATGMALELTMMEHCEEFTANKPFVFLILESQKSVILFQGLYAGED